jgi:hypothetical protein
MQLTGARWAEAAAHSVSCNTLLRHWREAVDLSPRSIAASLTEAPIAHLKAINSSKRQFKRLNIPLAHLHISQSVQLPLTETPQRQELTRTIRSTRKIFNMPQLFPSNPSATMVIRDVTSNIVTMSLPFARFGIFHFGGRGTLGEQSEALAAV